MLTITGNGFIDGHTIVMIGNSMCHVETTSLVEIVCVTSEGTTGTYPVIIHSGGALYPDSQMFEYKLEITPSVRSIEPGRHHIDIHKSHIDVVDTGLKLLL